MPAGFTKLASNTAVRYAAQGLGTRVRQQLLRQKMLGNLWQNLEANFGTMGQNIVKHGTVGKPATGIRGRIIR